MSTAALNKDFAIGGHLTFKDTPGGPVIAEVNNAHATASICLQGGHVMSWQPKTEKQPVVWLSPLAKIATGKSIRGGVPVCWPWFGAHAAQASYPAHGYARTVAWEVAATKALTDGSTQFTLVLQETEQTRAMWPYRTRLSVVITVGTHLKVVLATQNLGTEEVTIGEALHTYFQIGDIGTARITGLDGCEYMDKAAGGTRHHQAGPVTFCAETDRVYVGTESPCVIEDPTLKRRIHIAKSGSRSTVVWNPWTEKADKMGDFGPNGWRGMLCVESANALEDVVQVPAGATHELSVDYWAERA